MNINIIKTTLQDAIKQRNVFLLTTLLSLVILLLETFWLVSGLGINERVIIVPPNMHAVGYVDKDGVSASYLADMTRYYALLFLDVTPSNASSQANALLNYVAPEHYGALKEQLLAQADKLKQHALSLRFAPISTEVDNTALVADITGDLHFYVGKSEVNVMRVTYRVHYRLVNGALLISSFNVLENKKGDHNA